MAARAFALVSLGAALLAGMPGCASYQAARLYRSGTDALERGDTTEALADLESAAQLAPQASEVQNHLGLAYGAAGRRQEALAAFRRAVELDCDNRAAQSNLLVAERSFSGSSQ